jgi:membrane associated rhomboid family serine protease
MVEDRDYMRAPEDRGGSFWERVNILHIIVALNVLLFFFGESLLGLFTETEAGPVDQERLIRWGGVSLVALAEGQFWTAFTHMFLHASPLHLIGNLLLIWFAGTRVMMLLGAKALVQVYLLGGLVGVALQIAIDAWVVGSTSIPIIGASACACATGFALAAMLPQERATLMLYFIIPVNLRLWTLAVSILVIEFVLGASALVFDWAHALWGGNAYFAHIGGALFGWYFVRLLGYGGQPMTYAQLWHQQPAQRRPTHRAVARMRRLQNAMPEMDHDAIRRKRQAPGQSDLPMIEDVDAVLDKINREGIGSLTEAERRLLEAASRDLSRQPPASKPRG